MTIPYHSQLDQYLSRVPLDLCGSCTRSTGTTVASRGLPLLKGKFPSSHDIPSGYVLAMENPHAINR